jgi:glycerophosphoryl diester phosphodiesterase
MSWMAGPSPATNVLREWYLLKGLNLPLVIGHRGAAAHAPENTLAGFHAAKVLGCAWVEFDVRLTADGALVVCHDDKLDRTTDGHGRISKLPFAALQAFDAGRWFTARFAGERIPTLDAALGLCRELGLGVNVEIKAERGRASATAAAVADCLDRFADPLPSVLISSFLPDAMATAAEQMPDIPRGMLWRKPPRGWRQIAANFDCATIHLGQADVTQAIAAQVCEAGYPLLVYTVNDPARARQLFGWGVTSVFSDTPDIIASALPEDLPLRDLTGA